MGDSRTHDLNLGLDFSYISIERSMFERDQARPHGCSLGCDCPVKAIAITTSHCTILVHNINTFSQFKLYSVIALLQCTTVSPILCHATINISPLHRFLDYLITQILSPSTCCSCPTFHIVMSVLPSSSPSSLLSSLQPHWN